MKVFAHVAPDGRIRALVAMPTGERTARMVTAESSQVCELTDHGITSVGHDLQALRRLFETQTVMLTSARGKLVPYAPKQ
jgi:hypothetical protein